MAVAECLNLEWNCKLSLICPWMNGWGELVSEFPSDLAGEDGTGNCCVWTDLERDRKKRQKSLWFHLRIVWVWGANGNKKAIKPLLMFLLRIYGFEYRKRTHPLGKQLLFFRVKFILGPHAICPNPHEQIAVLLRVHGLGFKNWIKSCRFCYPTWKLSVSVL